MQAPTPLYHHTGRLVHASPELSLVHTSPELSLMHAGPDLSLVHAGPELSKCCDILAWSFRPSSSAYAGSCLCLPSFYRAATDVMAARGQDLKQVGGGG